MHIHRSIGPSLVLAFSSSGATGQDLPPEPDSFTVQSLGHGLYGLLGPDRNIVASTGPDGTLLVDAQYDGVTSRILAAMDEIDGSPVRFVVTPGRGVFTPGNDGFVQGIGNLLVLHDNTWQRQTARPFQSLVGRGDEPALDNPAVVIVDGDSRLYWNQITVRGQDSSPSQAADDTVITVDEANIVYIGALALDESFPLLEVESAREFYELLETIWTVLQNSTSSTTIVPRRGPVLGRDELLAYFDFLAISVTSLDALEVSPDLFSRDFMDYSQNFYRETGHTSTWPGRTPEPSADMWDFGTPGAPVGGSSDTEAFDAAYQAFGAILYGSAAEPLTSGDDWARQRRESLRVGCSSGHTTDSLTYDSVLESMCTDPWSSNTMQILAIGDSWFSYPASNLIKMLINENTDDKKIVLVQDRSKSGSQLLQHISGPGQTQLADDLRSNQPDFLFVSYGGNDIINEIDLSLILKDGDAVGESDDYLDYIHENILEAKLRRIEAALEYVIRLRDAHSADTTVVLHTYDYVLPMNNPIGVEDAGLVVWIDKLIDVMGEGPWVWSALSKKKIDRHHSRIANHILDGLAGAIKKAPTFGDKIVVAETLGTLRPGAPEHWADEIHPSARGFCEIWIKIAHAMRQAVQDGHPFLSAYPRDISPTVCDPFGPAPAGR